MNVVNVLNVEVKPNAFIAILYRNIKQKLCEYSVIHSENFLTIMQFLGIISQSKWSTYFLTRELEPTQSN